MSSSKHTQNYAKNIHNMIGLGRTRQADGETAHRRFTLTATDTACNVTMSERSVFVTSKGC